MVSPCGFVRSVVWAGATAVPFTDEEVAGMASFQRNSTAPPASTSSGKAAKLEMALCTTFTCTAWEAVDPCELVACSTYEVVACGETVAELPVTVPGCGSISILRAPSTFQLSVTESPRRIRSRSTVKEWMDGAPPQAPQSAARTRTRFKAVPRIGRGRRRDRRRRSGWTSPPDRPPAGRKGSCC